MKSTAHPSSHCSRCGDEISSEELKFLEDATQCAFCANTHIECLEIYHSSVKKPKQRLTLARKTKTQLRTPA